MTYADIIDNLLDRFAEVEEEKAVDRVARKAISLALLPIYAVLSVPASLILSKVKNVLGGRIRFAVSGTGAIPQNVATFFRALGIPILDAWGMTETTGAAVVSALPWPKRGAIGKPLPGVQVQLRDDTGKVISRHGVKGVLWMKAPSVMQGYYEAPEKTEAVLQDGWMSSGDLFMWTLDGDLKFLRSRQRYDRTRQRRKRGAGARRNEATRQRSHRAGRRLRPGRKNADRNHRAGLGRRALRDDECGRERAGGSGRLERR